MTMPEPSIRVAVDPTNPGQFFACCGLLELADRLWPGAEGWFAEGGREFRIASKGTLGILADKLRAAGIQGALTPILQAERAVLDSEKRLLKKDRKKLPEAKEKRRKELGKLYREGSLILPTPFNLLLDWWRSEDDSIPKTWAGSQAVIRIALASHDGCTRLLTHANPFQEYLVMRPAAAPDDEDDDVESGDKVEPFYFDAQRGTNALARDIGFVPDALQIETHASPVVEFLTLVGVQRGRPRPTNKPREFEYFTWSQRTSAVVLPAAVVGALGDCKEVRYRFRNAFRTGQEKHKAFMPAIPILTGESS